jgi:hypothetical protein
MIDQPQKPHPAATYWVHEQLLAGDYPGEKLYRYSSNLPHVPFVEELLQLGVGCFIDLTEAHESTPGPYRVKPYQDLIAGKAEYRRVPIIDETAPDLQTTQAVLNTIDEATTAGRLVYLHCRGGVGRTGTIVGCHLVRKFGIPGEQALTELDRLWKQCAKSKRRRHVPEQPEQFDRVRHWQG